MPSTIQQRRLDALSLAVEDRRAAEVVEVRAIRAALAADCSISAIARALGVTRQAAQQRIKTLEGSAP